MGGVIRPARTADCDCGGRFQSHFDEQLERKVPRCNQCGQAPRLLKVRVTLPGTREKQDIRYDAYGKRFTTVARASAFLDNVHSEIESGKFDPLKYLSSRKKDELKLRHFLMEFEKEKRKLNQKGCSPKYAHYVGVLNRKYLIPYFGDFDVRDIKYRHLKAYMSSDLGTRGQRTKALVVLRTVLREARKSIPSMEMPEFPKTEPNRLRTDVIDRETQMLILSHVSEYKEVIETLTMYPVRPCEVRALKWKDINRLDKSVTFRRHFSGATLIEGRKSASHSSDPTYSVRYQLLPRFVEILTSLAEPRDLDDFIFKGARGPFICESALNRSWQRACRRAKVEVCGLYVGTRHSLLTHLHKEVGASVDDLRILAGHTDRRTTDRYVRTKAYSLSPFLEFRGRNGGADEKTLENE